MITQSTAKHTEQSVRTGTYKWHTVLSDTKPYHQNLSNKNGVIRNAEASCALGPGYLQYNVHLFPHQLVVLQHAIRSFIVAALGIFAFWSSTGVNVPLDFRSTKLVL